MRLRLRCTDLAVEPSDTSGLIVTLEVADVQELLSQAISKDAIYAMDEPTMRAVFGDRHFEENAAAGARAISRAFEECGIAPPEPKCTTCGDTGSVLADDPNFVRRGNDTSVCMRRVPCTDCAEGLEETK